MKRFSYLFVCMLISIIGVGMVKADDTPQFTTSFDVTQNEGTDTLSIIATVRNSETTCSGVGLKQGKVYVYLDETVVEKPATSDMSAIYKDYNETTDSFSSSNMTCSYDGENSRVVCLFGRSVTDPAMIQYSDCKDEIEITIQTTLCENETNCDNIKVEVEGIRVDSSNNPIGDGTATVVSSDSFDCTSTNVISDSTTTDSTTDTTYEPDENPDTFDGGLLYLLVGMLSLILMTATISIYKKRKEA